MATKSLVQDMEQKIAAMVIDEAIKHGYFMRVFDGENFCTKRIQDKDAILAAMFSSDEDRLYLYRHPEAKTPHEGWIEFIYGNDGYDVVSDYNVNLEHVMAPINEFTAQYA